MPRVLVAGATGETGRRVVERLAGAGQHQLRVLSRDADRARALLGPEVEVHEGDLRVAESLAGIMDGVDLVVSAVGTRTYFGKNGGAAVDALGMRHLCERVERSSVRQLLLVSAFGLDRRSVFLSGFSLLLNRYFHWKAEAERAVREAGVPYTILRPVELRNRAPRGQACLNQAEPLSLLRTVSRDLVAETLVLCLDHPAALNKTVEVYEGQASAPLTEQLAQMRLDGERPRPRRTPLC